ncbi:MAG: helix-turn-helix domain-containing protein, partial [Eubacterium sp.]|nr:helix-turn-helix domain-containing protein [Eubacterium sp.]MDE6155841.1 helix-turn-helix domain-containing protein [Eubacterium sp.]
VITIFIFEVIAYKINKEVKVMSVDYKQIGKRIQKERKKTSITQETLAEMLDVSTGYISQIERGITKANLTTIDNICNHIGCDLSYIITGVSVDK